MYLIPSMIDMGLKEGKKWPSLTHKEVAQVLALNNQNVKTRDALTEIVQGVIKIPKRKIKYVTFQDCRDLGIPFI